MQNPKAAATKIYILGCPPLTQTSRVEILCINIKVFKFDEVRDRPTKNYVQIS